MTARSRPSFVRPSSASQLRPNPESLTSGTVRSISTPDPDETPEPRTTTEGSSQTVTEPAEDSTATPPAPSAPPAKAQPLKRRARRVAQSARPPVDESDLPMPPPKHDDTVMVNFSSRLDTDLNDRFYEFVQQHRTTVQAVLNQALDEYLGRRGA